MRAERDGFRKMGGEPEVKFKLSKWREWRGMFRESQEQMREMVDSGESERRFGVEFGRHGLEARAAEMFDELKALAREREFRSNRKRSAIRYMWTPRREARFVGMSGIESLLDSGSLDMLYEIDDDWDTVGNLGPEGWVIKENDEIELGYKVGGGVLGDRFVFESGQGFWEWHSGHSRKRKGMVRVTDPVLPVCGEEFLHGADAIARGFLTSYKELDPRIREASSETAHGSLLIDWVLTAAAVEMGDFGYWNALAKRMTKQDRARLNIPMGVQRTVLGFKINERFGYPMMTERHLDLVIHAMNERIGYLFDAGGDATGELFELMGLAYGAEYGELMFRILECEGAVNGGKTVIWGGRKAIELGKRILLMRKGEGAEADLVRHQKPWRGEMGARKFRYAVDSLHVMRTIELQGKGYPMSVTIDDLFTDVLLNSKTSCF